MQLMPGTAAEQAKRLGLPSSTQALIDDPMYNTTLGNAYFQRLVTSYRGSYPLAIAAYNAGRAM
jgi:soluble lytic murein transglycosylase